MTTPRKVHSFRADTDVEEILQAIDKYYKSPYINKAIRDTKKLESIKEWENSWGHHVNNLARTELLKILGDKPDHSGQ